MRPRRQSLFLLASLLAVGCGCWVAHRAGLAPSLWVRNLLAWALGLGAAWFVERAQGVSLQFYLLLGLLALLGCFLSPGLAGPSLSGEVVSAVAHRWLGTAPLRLHAASLVLPPLVVLLAAGQRHRLLWSPLIAMLLAAQPDASQAWAFAAAFSLWQGLPAFHPSALFAWLSSFAVLAAALYATVHEVFLPPVPHVEGIAQLAWQQSPALAVTLTLLLFGALALPACHSLTSVSSGTARRTSLALSVYLLFTALAPLLGPYPVPLAGIAPSPILGAWLGLGMLGRLDRDTF